MVGFVFFVLFCQGFFVVAVVVLTPRCAIGKLVWFKCYFVNRVHQMHKYIVEKADTLKTVYFRELDIFIMEEVYPETATELNTRVNVE